ncbi:MAG: DUF1080 domain-containing protein [Planctomycetales bacterium]|nr:DUF1080 domain-containing protein [Planctomycetales bacterium]
MLSFGIAFSAALSLSLASRAVADDVVILEDDFSREEADPAKEQVGNGWGTNSATRAKGVKQVDLADGAMHITMAAVADHGVSVRHDAEFRDATISLRFKLGKGDDLGINIADLKEKSVHAGHICVARVQLNRVELTDLKTGRMHLETRERRLAKKDTAEDKQRLRETTKQAPVKLTADQWHQLEVKIVGETMAVSIDGKQVGEFSSPGIGHPTKRMLRLAVNHSAWVDDVRIVRHK